MQTPKDKDNADTQRQYRNPRTTQTPIATCVDEGFNELNGLPLQTRTSEQAVCLPLTTRGRNRTIQAPKDNTDPNGNLCG